MVNIAEKVISNFNGKSIIEGIDKEQLKEFTRKYYGLIVLSGRKNATLYTDIRIDVFPYVNKKEIKETLSNNYKEYATTEDILLCFRASENQELYITERGIYFNMFDLIDEEYNRGFIPFESINSLDIIQKGDYFCLECNGILLITDNVKNKDFYEDIDLKEYFSHIVKKDLVISENEMADAVKRHMNVELYEMIAQKLCNYKIINAVFGSNYILGFRSYTRESVLVFVPNNFIVYQITGHNWHSMREYKTNSFKLYSFESSYRYIYGNRYDDYFSYNSRQMSYITQYMNEICDKKEKEKAEALEADIQKQVEKLVKLKTIGLLTDKEFEEKRLALLERMGI